MNLSKMTTMNIIVKRNNPKAKAVAADDSTLKSMPVCLEFIMIDLPYKFIFNPSWHRQLKFMVLCRYNAPTNLFLFKFSPYIARPVQVFT